MRHWPILGLILTGVLLAGPVRADTVVLIVSAHSSIDRLESFDVRKLYLGFRVERIGQALHALRNDSDPKLKAIFLQNVMGMSEFDYDYRVLRLRLQQGAETPRVFTDTATLLAAIAADPTLVGYVWRSELKGVSGLRILRTLWSE